MDFPSREQRLNSKKKGGNLSFKIDGVTPGLFVPSLSFGEADRRLNFDQD